MPNYDCAEKGWLAMPKLLLPLLALVLLLGGAIYAQDVPPETAVGMLQVADVLPAADSV